MEINNKNILNDLIKNYCILSDDLYYDIDHKLISSITYTLIKLNIYYSQSYLYNYIITKIKNNIQLTWCEQRMAIKRRNNVYKIIDYIVDKKQINNFENFLKFKIYDYYLK